MLYKNIEIFCPVCQGELEPRSTPQAGLACQNCPNTYPIIAGIPDFRIFSDPYIDIQSDRSKALDIERESARTDFAGLLDYYYSSTDVVPAAHAAIYKRGMLAGVAKSEAALSAWENHSGRSINSLDRMLDLGCGTAPLLVAASQKTRQLIGVDIALRWLVVAKKRLSEANLDIPLLCACAEALPFRDTNFNMVAAESAIEHFKDQTLALEECWRVLQAGGYLFITTPNRYSLGPDPNVGIFAGGYLPDKLLAKMVRQRGGIPPKRNLFSAYQLGLILKEADFQKISIALADFPESQRRLFNRGMRFVIDGYSLAKRLPVSKQLLYMVGPLFYAVAQKGSLQ